MKKLLSLLAIITIFSLSSAQAHDKESSVYDRVINNKTLVCGYMNRHPILTKKLDGSGFEGIYYEYVEALGKSLNLKIEWKYETGWGDIIEALKTDKIDAFCSGLWPVSKRAPHIDFVRPIFFEPMVAYTRINETRFDNNKEEMNKKEIRFVTIEGTAPALITSKDFPHATINYLPQLSPISDLFVYLATNKADITLAEISVAEKYMEHNPNKIKRIKLDIPIRSFGLSLPIKAGEYKLKRMLDIATEELLQTGEIENIIMKYEKYNNSFYRVAKPYEARQ